MFRSRLALARLAGPTYGLAFWQLEFLVLDQEIVDRLPQKGRSRRARFGGQLLEQLEPVVVEVQGLNCALRFTHIANGKLPVALRQEYSDIMYPQIIDQ